MIGIRGKGGDIADFDCCGCLACRIRHRLVGACSFAAGVQKPGQHTRKDLQ